RGAAGPPARHNNRVCDLHEGSAPSAATCAQSVELQRMTLHLERFLLPYLPLDGIEIIFHLYVQYSFAIRTNEMMVMPFGCETVTFHAVVEFHSVQYFFFFEKLKLTIGRHLIRPHALLREQRMDFKSGDGFLGFYDDLNNALASLGQPVAA